MPSGFPPAKPAVYELYWTPSQILARGHPNVLKTQAFLMSQWHSANESALISTANPITYADRLRIRQPGDAGFALGPHIDAGSCERWEENGYGRGNVYKDIFNGVWEQYDPWESSCRLPVVADLYNGAGACSMFRMFQGWLSMSETGPGEGTLMVNPLLGKATAYLLLRPFFTSKRSSAETSASAFLDSDNWTMEAEPTPVLQGAVPSNCQELNDVLHPHLRLDITMVHVSTVRPGDYVAWHCDSKLVICVIVPVRVLTISSDPRRRQNPRRHDRFKRHVYSCMSTHGSQRTLLGTAARGILRRYEAPLFLHMSCLCLFPSKPPSTCPSNKSKSLSPQESQPPISPAAQESTTTPVTPSPTRPPSAPWVFVALRSPPLTKSSSAQGNLTY